MKSPDRSDDFFDRWGAEGDVVVGILEGCEIPPSAEVFSHGLEQVRGRTGMLVHIRNYARTLVDTYSRETLDMRPGPCSHKRHLAGLTSHRQHEVRVCPVCDCIDAPDVAFDPDDGFPGYFQSE